MKDIEKTPIKRRYLFLRKKKHKPKNRFCKNRIAIIHGTAKPFLTHYTGKPFRCKLLKIKSYIHASKHVTVNQQLRAFLVYGILFVMNIDIPRCRSPPLQSEFFNPTKNLDWSITHEKL